MHLEACQPLLRHHVPDSAACMHASITQSASLQWPAAGWNTGLETETDPDVLTNAQVHYCSARLPASAPTQPPACLPALHACAACVCSLRCPAAAGRRLHNHTSIHSTSPGPAASFLQTVAVMYMALTAFIQFSILLTRNPSFWWHFGPKRWVGMGSMHWLLAAFHPVPGSCRLAGWQAGRRVCSWRCLRQLTAPPSPAPRLPAAPRGQAWCSLLPCWHLLSAPCSWQSTGPATPSPTAAALCWREQVWRALSRLRAVLLPAAVARHGSVPARPMHASCSAPSCRVKRLQRMARLLAHSRRLHVPAPRRAPKRCPALLLPCHCPALSLQAGCQCW
jgi:hypothetical protein